MHEQSKLEVEDLRTFLLHNDFSSFLILLLGDPHLLERALREEGEGKYDILDRQYDSATKAFLFVCFTYQRGQNGAPYPRAKPLLDRPCVLDQLDSDALQSGWGREEQRERSEGR